MKNPYSVLELPRDAAQAEVKKRYRALAKKYHPDRQSGDATSAERFKEISAAYNILGDPKMRERFDRGEIDTEGNERVHAGFHQPGAGMGRGHPGFTAETMGFGVDFEDLLSPLFGGRARAAQSRRAPPFTGANKTQRVEVKFLEAALGTKRRITIDGRQIEVAVPAGIDTGQTIRLKGQGNQGSNGGPPGNLLVTVSVSKHPLFTRSGDDISIDMPVTVGEAVLGAKIDAPTVHGPVSLTIPKGSNTGSRLRLKDQGIRRKNGKSGDQYVRLQVVLPDAVDSEFSDFVSKWSQDHVYDPRGKLKY